MRLLTALVAILATLWGGYWFIGSSAVEKGAIQLLADIRADGLEVNYSALGTRGFPNRFDTTISDPELTYLPNGIGWQAPFFKLFALSYRPNHLIALWPDTQRLILPQGVVDITTEDMRASLVLEPDTGLALDRSRLQIDTLSVTPESSAPTLVERAYLATRQATARAFAHDLALEIEGITLPADLRQQLDGSGHLPQRMSGLNIDATLQFNAPISLQDQLPKLTEITFRTAEARWDALSLGLSGTLKADNWGYAEGTLQLESDNWRAVFEVLAETGLVDPVWEGAIEPLANADGNPDTLNTSLRFANGTVYFGPLALGPSPRLN